MIKKILIIDDEKNIIRSLDLILSSEGFEVTSAGSLKEAREKLKHGSFNIFLVDVMLPDGDGIEFISGLRQTNPHAVIVMISGHASIQMAIEATRKGADDFLEKPLSREKLLITLANFVKQLELQQRYSDLKNSLQETELIGDSPAIRAIREQIAKIAPSNSKVLITGESGSGKEIVAHLIHQMSKRNAGPYVKINCAAIPEELIEAELFGAEKGAYTGAGARREGRFVQADGGTLFLDEIADMSPATQTKVLRVLQDGCFERVGGTETLSTDVRIIAATNKNLEQAIRDGHFREDLFFRLHVMPIHIPPLRERPEDIPLLADYFLDLFRTENNRQAMQFDKMLLERLQKYTWPGNVRELKNVIERMVILAESPQLTQANLPVDFERTASVSVSAGTGDLSLRDFREKTEADYLKQLLEKNNGNIARTAEILQVDRTYLYKKLRKLGLR